MGLTWKNGFERGLGFTYVQQCWISFQRPISNNQDRLNLNQRYWISLFGDLNRRAQTTVAVEWVSFLCSRTWNKSGLWEFMFCQCQNLASTCRVACKEASSVTYWRVYHIGCRQTWSVITARGDNGLIYELPSLACYFADHRLYWTLLISFIFRICAPLFAQTYG